MSLSLGETELSVGAVTVGEAEEPALAGFSNVVFAEGVSSNGAPVNPHQAGEPFQAGIPGVYAFFEYRGMEEGMTWSTAWYLDGQEVLSEEDSWKAGEEGDFWVMISHKNGLPEGRYRLELSILGEPAAEAEFSVRGGDADGRPDEGVQVIGEILDADTQRPIPGAAFIVLNPGVSVGRFLRDLDEDLVYAWGEADQNGQFSLSRALERGFEYNFVAAAEGYQVTTEEGYPIDESADSPLELTIWLQKR